jgi:hypothetical protein
MSLELLVQKQTSVNIDNSIPYTSRLLFTATDVHLLSLPDFFLSCQMQQYLMFFFQKARTGSWAQPDSYLMTKVSSPSWVKGNKV